MNPITYPDGADESLKTVIDQLNSSNNAPKTSNIIQQAPMSGIWENIVSGVPITTWNSPTLSGLSVNGYDFVIFIVNAYVGVLNVRMQYNGDPVDGNYLTLFGGGSATALINQISNGAIGYMRGTIEVTPSLLVFATFWQMNTSSGSISGSYISQRKTTAITGDLKLVTVTVDQIGGIGINSFIRLQPRK